MRTLTLGFGRNAKCFTGGGAIYPDLTELKRAPYVRSSGSKRA
jgi:hypothetical protein